MFGICSSDKTNELALGYQHESKVYTVLCGRSNVVLLYINHLMQRCNSDHSVVGSSSLHVLLPNSRRAETLG
jgi:hypothetical protein